MKGFNKKIDYLCFTANTAGSTVKLQKNGSPTAVTLETSTDGVNWVDYTIGTYITLSNVGDKVYIRNKSETTTGFSSNTANYYKFGINGSVGASGDITYLLNKNGTTTLSNYCFYSLFTTLGNLTTAPSLIATTLAQYCYASMFNKCTGLTTLPKLPATTAPIACYNGMFSYCSSIKLSTTQTGEYQNEYRIPITGTMGSTGNNWNAGMFANTGGTFKSNPSANTTYYTSNTVI